MRDWLQAPSPQRSGLAGGGEILDRYRRFQADLPAICDALALEPDKPIRYGTGGRLALTIFAAAVLPEWMQSGMPMPW